MANVISLHAGHTVKQTSHSMQTVISLTERRGHFQLTAVVPLQIKMCEEMNDERQIMFDPIWNVPWTTHMMLKEKCDVM